MPAESTTIIVYVILFGLMGLMWNNGRKRKKAALEMQSSLGAGSEVMLTSGIYATIVSVDGDKFTVKSGTSTLVVAKAAILRQVAAAPKAKPATPAKKAPAKAAKTAK